MKAGFIPHAWHHFGTWLLVMLPSLTGTELLFCFWVGFFSKFAPWMNLLPKKCTLLFFWCQTDSFDDRLRRISFLLLPRNVTEPKSAFWMDQSQSSMFTSRRINATYSQDFCFGFFLEVFIKLRLRVTVDYGDTEFSFASSKLKTIHLHSPDCRWKQV